MGYHRQGGREGSGTRRCTMYSAHPPKVFGEANVGFGDLIFSPAADHASNPVNPNKATALNP